MQRCPVCTYQIMASRSSSLWSYTLTRLMMAPLMIWFAVTLVFLLVRALPGDPIDAELGPKAPPELKAELRAAKGYDKPMIVQYLVYLGSLIRFNVQVDDHWELIHFDLGDTLKKEAVTKVIGQYFPATVELTIFSLLVAVGVGVTIGAFAASRPNSKFDVGGRLFGIITYSIPLFWFGMILQLIFSVGLNWFPLGTRFPTTMMAPEGPTGLYTIDSLLKGDLSQFATSLYYLALPCLSLGILISGVFERIVRVNLKQTLQADYVEAARARGIGENRILWNHAFRNTLIPVVTILGLTIAAMLGGAILTEVTFSWPGLAQRLYLAISQRDYAAVQGIMVFFAVIVTIASLAIDLINAYIDPRIRY
jgi:peptide/nickel transport system permease protein